MRHAFTFFAIGHAVTPFVEKRQAPRQGVLATEACRIELVDDVEAFGASFEHALTGLERFDRVWVLFVFDRAGGYRPKVLPPRSDQKLGVLATRSPHRPNPIGLTTARLERVEGRTLHVRELDLLDGTPILDVKPYVPYADAFPEASSGWLERPPDPKPAHEVEWSDAAREKAERLASLGVPLAREVEQALALGLAPHPYRRIRGKGARRTLAWKDWRVDFEVRAADALGGPERALVVDVRSGYAPSALARGEAPAEHLAFTSASSPTPPHAG